MDTQKATPRVTVVPANRAAENKLARELRQAAIDQKYFGDQRRTALHGGGHMVQRVESGE